MRRVWDLLQRGQSRIEISSTLGLPLKAISTTIQNLRREGYLPRPSRVETRQTMRAAVSRARGGVGLAVEPYARMGMTPREIRIALALEGGSVYTLAQISRAVARGRESASLPPTCMECAADVRRQARLGERKLRESIQQWVLCKNWLAGRKLDLPEHRLDWKQAAEEWRRDLEMMLALRGGTPDDISRIVRPRPGECLSLAEALVREALQQGHIGPNLEDWRDLRTLYSCAVAPRGATFAQTVQLELLLAALRASTNADPGPLNTYRKLVAAVELFPHADGSLAAHERFLALKVFCPWADGEDRRGLYAIRNGTRAYAYSCDAEGHVVYDTTQRAIQRWRARQVRMPGAAPGRGVLTQHAGPVA